MDTPLQSLHYGASSFTCCLCPNFSSFGNPLILHGLSLALLPLRKASPITLAGKQVMVPYAEDNLKFVFWLLIDTDEESARTAKQDQYRFLLVMGGDGVHGWGNQLS